MGKFPLLQHKTLPTKTTNTKCFNIFNENLPFDFASDLNLLPMSVTSLLERRFFNAVESILSLIDQES